MKQINLLGEDYIIEERNVKNDAKLKDCDGYHDETRKLCVIDDFKDKRYDGLLEGTDIEKYKNQILRHELIHAILFESGLSNNSWADNEAMVDWIAIQFPKIVKVFKQADCL